mmetsp:Transcript_29819/g.69489  ORF Transcript_29819/g.69489 Transcript_29819/m.69489 type:complete len:978 (+) Transcript_29819:398-3331(+)
MANIMAEEDISFLDPLGELLSERVYDAGNVKRQGNVDVYDSNIVGQEIALCHVYAILPFSDGDKVPWNTIGSIESIFALALAAQHLNTGNSSIVDQVEGLPDRCPVRFSLEVADSELSESVTVNSVVETLSRQSLAAAGMVNTNSNLTLSNSNKNIPLTPCFFVGAGRSAVSIPSSIFTGLQGHPQLSPISTSTALDDKSQHPLFGRTVPADDGTAFPLIIYFRDILKVKHLGVIHINDAYGSAFGQGLQAAAQVLAPDMAVQAVEVPLDGSQERIEYAIQILKNTGYAYFFGILFPTKLIDATMEEAYRQGIQGDGQHQWFFSDSAGGELVSRSFPRDSVLAKSYMGAGIISASAGSPQFNPKYQKLIDSLRWLRSKDQVMDFVNSILPTHWESPNFDGYESIYSDPNFLDTPGLIGPFVYDIMISAGLAACQVYSNFNPELTGAGHFQAIVNQNFLGTSGRVQLDPLTGTREAASAFFQIQNHVIDTERTTETDIQLKAVLSDVFQEGTWVELEEYVFNDGTTNVPPGVIPVDVERNHFTPGVRAGGLVMCGICMALAVACMVWTKWNKEQRVVLASQPIFLYLIAAGVIVFCSAIIPLSVDDGVASMRGCDIACQSTPWLMSIGFTLIFSALFTKTYRISQIVHGAKHFKRIKLTVRQVAKPMMALLGLNVIVLLLSTLLGPLFWDFHVEEQDSFGQTVEGYGFCNGDDALPYLLTLCGLNFGALCFAIYQAYQARNISIQYAESQYIFRAAVSILMICCFGIPILLLADRGDAYFFVSSAVIFCCSCAILFFIFVPKIQFVNEENKRNMGPEQDPMGFLDSGSLATGSQGPIVSGLDVQEDLGPSEASEEDDGGIGVEIITSKTKEELLRENTILKQKLRSLNVRPSRVVRGIAREMEPLVLTPQEESSMLYEEPNLPVHREVVDTEELSDVATEDAVDDPKTATTKSPNGSLCLQSQTESTTEGLQERFEQE